MGPIQARRSTKPPKGAETSRGWFVLWKTAIMPGGPGYIRVHRSARRASLPYKSDPWMRKQADVVIMSNSVQSGYVNVSGGQKPDGRLQTEMKNKNTSKTFILFLVYKGYFISLILPGRRSSFGESGTPCCGRLHECKHFPLRAASWQNDHQCYITLHHMSVSRRSYPKRLSINALHPMLLLTSKKTKKKCSALKHSGFVSWFVHADATVRQSRSFGALEGICVTSPNWSAVLPQCLPLEQWNILTHSQIPQLHLSPLRVKIVV